MEYYIAIIAAAVGAIAENISYGWADDNLSIPIATGLALWGLYALLLPDINLWNVLK
jgi:dolichol kinase